MSTRSLLRVPDQASEPRPRRRASIGLYVGAVIVLQAVLFSGLTILAGISDYRDQSAEAADASARRAKLAAGLISTSVDAVAAQMTGEAALSGYDAVFGSESECVLTSGGIDAFARVDIHIVGLDGAMMCSSVDAADRVRGRDYAASGWLDDLERAQPATPVRAGPLVDPVTGQRVLVVAARLANTSGALVTTLHLGSLTQGLSTVGQGQPAMTFTITSSDRRTLLVGPGGEQGQSLRGTGFDRSLEERKATFSDLSGVDRIYGEAVVKDLGWHVWAGVSSDAALAEARGAMRDTFFLGIGALIVVLVVGAFIRRRITRPVRALAKAADEAAEGNLESHVPTDGPRELANLGERFNHMLDMRARSEEALMEAYEKERLAAVTARELEAMKSSFLMAISHELRTPLTSVVGYACLLEDSGPELSEEDRLDATRRIATQAKRLEGLLVDLLDVERMSRGTIEAHRREVRLRDLVMRVVEQIAGAARVSVRVRADLRVSVDAGLMERVTENLIVNAIKHTPPGTRIIVRASRGPDGVVLVVEDFGPGVPDELKEAIFEPFRQGDVPEHSPGTGVGLALVKQFAKLHGGHAWVVDRPGGGASFRVLLPDDVQRNGSRTKKQAAAPRRQVA